MTDDERQQLTKLVRAVFGENGTPGLLERARETEAEIFGSKKTGQEGLVQWKRRTELRILQLTAGLAGAVAMMSIIVAGAQYLGATRMLRVLEAVTALRNAIP